MAQWCAAAIALSAERSLARRAFASGAGSLSASLPGAGWLQKGRTNPCNCVRLVLGSPPIRSSGE
jgi:hypothetical protein